MRKFCAHIVSHQLPALRYYDEAPGPDDGNDMTEPTDPTDPQDTAGETKLERWRRIMADMHADAPRPEESPLPAILEYLTSPEIMATMNEVVGDISLALASFLSDEVKQLRADLARSNEQTSTALAVARQSKEQTDTALAAVRQSTDVTKRALHMAEELNGEVKQLRSDLNTLARRYASSGDLLELYAERHASDPSLSLRRFLDQLGAPGRYRALISARERQRRKDAMHQNAENAPVTGTEPDTSKTQ
jgi:hypothetical protein